MKYNRKGRNVFGEKCITKFAVLNKETAKEQYIDALEDILRGKDCGILIEYTFAFEGFTPSELYEITQWMKNVMAIVQKNAA